MVQRGQVVEFIEDDRFVVAACLEVKNDRPRLLTQQGREVVVPLRRLLNSVGPSLNPNLSRDETLSRLRDLAARREKLSEEVDLAGLWDLVVDDYQDGALAPEFAAGLIFGEPVDPNQVAALIRAVVADKVRFRFRPEGLAVIPRDKVEQLLTQRQREAELAQARVAIGSWLAAVWQGQLSERPAQAAEVIGHLVDVALNGPDSPHAGRVRGYLEAAGIKGDQAPFRLLVKLGEFGPDEDLDLRRLGLPTAFPSALLTQAEALARTGMEGFDWSGRVDLTDLDVFTIDGMSSRDFDDALSFQDQGERCQVWVHITDTSPFVKPEADLDLEARCRAASVYLPDRRLPMLPEALSEGLLSLQQGQLRPALSLRVVLTRDGQIVEHELVKSKIRVTRRLIYGEVDRSLAQDAQMGRLAELAQRLKENRAAAGAMILEAPEVIVWPGPEGVQIDRIETPTPSRSLVAELMILANRVVAERLAGAGLAAPYRTQEAPKNGFEPPEGADPLWVLLRQRMLFARLEVCPAPGPHAGLGLPAYTTFTSPIRRYYDLIALRQLHALLDGRTPPYDQAAMEEALLTLQPTLRSHNQLKFRRQRYWLLKYLAQNKDQPLEAIVLLRLHDRFSLVLVETMLRIVTDRLPAGALVEGQRVMVRITKVNPVEDVIKVEVEG